MITVFLPEKEAPSKELSMSTQLFLLLLLSVIVRML